MTTSTAQFNLDLTEEERRELLVLLEEALVETHAEKRRTEAPEYQQHVLHHESLIRTLLGKVRGAER